MKLDEKIKEIDIAICKNIDNLDIFGRGFLSQNILSQLRNFIELIAIKIYENGQNIDINNDYNRIQNAIKYIKTKGKLKFLAQFHRFLQYSVSHYSANEENSERLMLKYYEYLVKTKKFLKNTYNIYVLSNINKFPINTDPHLKEYYKKISEKILQFNSNEANNKFNERYYIEKIKPFFVNDEIFYEITFIEARNWTSKTDRIIAFTKFEISKNYSVKFSFHKSTIQIFEKIMPILIITDWEISIRPCEIDNFSYILGKTSKTNVSDKEYRKMMSSLKQTGFNLLDIVEFNKEDYLNYKNQILEDVKKTNIFDTLDICRNIVNYNRPGANTIRYLLYFMNNRIIKDQKSTEECNRLWNLKLKFECIPFDQMPFASALSKHNPKIYDLLECINPEGRDHEFLANFIQKNSEAHGNLYTPINNLTNFPEPIKLIENYNKKLYSKHIVNRKIENYKDYLYISGYENNTYYIINKLKELASSGIKGYTESFISWLNLTNHGIDCEEKKKILPLMFENSKIALIYGSAGTGKSTLIDHISSFFNERKKIYLANTHPAVDNLRRKIKSSSNSEFMTITKFLQKKNIDKEYDLLIIDECSCVSNRHMQEILEKAQFELLILVGDIYQIESITFGNWFNLAKKFISKKSIFELTTPYRANNKQLIDLWTKVRNYDELITENLIDNNYCAYLDNTIFNKSSDDEIILCLNYDGLYGINNINRFLQENNPNPPISIGIKNYKVNDPILFNESKRFSPIIYNNLKGKIIKIEEIIGNKVQFDIEIDKALTELDVKHLNLTLIETYSNNKSIIRFLVNKYKDNIDEDEDQIDDIVPFQIAYAVSIHKAQGLEYESVKIVINSEVNELITHNIFYTAITRAKEKLKIYWTPETQKKILESFVKEESNKDYWLLSQKYKLNK